MCWLSFHVGHGELCLFCVSNVMELFLWFSSLCFQNLRSTTFSPPVLFSKFCSVPSSPIQQSFLKNYWQHQGTQGTSGMCSSFTFSPLPQGMVCACRVTLYFRKAFLHIWCYICCVLGWKEVHFLTVISFHGSLLCRLRILSPSHMCCIMSFIKPFSLEEIQLCFPLPCVSLLLFAEHLRESTVN